MHSQPVYVSDKALSARFDVSRSTIWRWTKDQHQQFPQPVKIFGSTRWKLSDIEAMESKLLNESS